MASATCSHSVNAIVMWQSRHTHLRIPTADFHLNALKYIHFGPLQFGPFYLLLLFNAFQYKTQKQASN